MEYLMTYGWAVLVIGIVLGVMYSLGIFNPASLAPKAEPGACNVFRPNGPGTVDFINLVGDCGNEIPKYTAEFNGHSSYVNTTSVLLNSSLTQFTISAWVKVNSATGSSVIAGSGGYCGAISGIGALGLSCNGANVAYFGGSCCGRVDASAHPLQNNQWYNLVGTYDNGNIALYINSVENISGTMTFGANTIFMIGGYYGSTLFNGSIANVQIYNTSLDADDIKYLYTEGIGGVPVDLQHIIAWYPLNGNANDYSGNKNDGLPENVTFTGSWQNGYTAP